MAINDAFTKEIVKLVRSMPDEAILALVKQQLGLGGGASLLPRTPVAAAPAAPARRGRKRGRKAKPAASSAAKAGSAPKRARARGAHRSTRSARGADRQALLGSVERVVKSSSGLAASEIARTAGVPQSRVTAALKELKLAKRIFQGGDRRFARYAGDPRTAQTASENARKTASGPQVKRKKR